MYGLIGCDTCFSEKELFGPRCADARRQDARIERLLVYLEW